MKPSPATPKAKQGKKAVKARLEIRSLKVGETSDHPMEGPAFESVFVLPATAEDYDRMHAQFWNVCLRKYNSGLSMSQAVTAGFASLGITRPAK